MPERYKNIVVDEIMYWFDVLQDNSMANIAAESGININKVQQILDAKKYFN